VLMLTVSHGLCSTTPLARLWPALPRFTGYAGIKNPHAGRSPLGASAGQRTPWRRGRVDL